MYISVVIPMYNSESTIVRALNSVLEQTVKPNQIIVVDDCSTDKSVDIVREIAKDNSIIQLICCDDNGGAQTARNIGIRAANGSSDTWIAFLDADDEWIENKLELQIDYLNKNPDCILAFGDGYVFDCDGQKYRKCGTEPIYSQENFISATVLFQTMLVKKRSIEEIGYLDNRVPCYQEWDTAIRLIQNNRFIYINKPLFKYYLDKGEHISTRIRSTEGFRYIVLKNRSLFSENMGIDAYSFYVCGLRDRQESFLKKKIYGLANVIYRFIPLGGWKKRIMIRWMERRYRALYDNG